MGISAATSPLQKCVYVCWGHTEGKYLLINYWVAYIGNCRDNRTKNVY